jgi:hypothetical protein
VSQETHFPFLILHKNQTAKPPRTEGYLLLVRGKSLTYRYGSLYETAQFEDQAIGKSETYRAPGGIATTLGDLAVSVP